jgi:HK97 family phage major capsid protein
MKLHELQEARANAVVAMRALSDLAETEKRDLTADEDKKFGDLKKEIGDLEKRISRAQAVADAERSAPAILHGRRGDGEYEERAGDFSIVKAMCAALPRELGGGSVDVGFERELSAEVVRRSRRTFQGIAVPDQVFLQDRRTLLVGSSAADLVPNVHRADLFIDRLRSKLVTQRLGATVLDGLIGTVDIPRQTGSSTAQWVAEDGSLSETDLTADDVNLSPKTVGAMTSYSRRTLLNTSPSIEQIVRNDLSSIIAAAIDNKAMLGDGSSNTPTGIVNAGATSLPLSATPTWGQILAFLAEIQSEDADVDVLAWALHPAGAKLLRSTTKVSSDAGAGFLMDEPGTLAGYPAATTTALRGGNSPDESTIIFGAWSQLLIGYWSGVDLLVNPYETTAYAKGRVLVRAMRDVDVQVRHAESFAFSDDLVVGA